MQQSVLLAKMFRGSFQDGKIQTATFPEDLAQRFYMLLGWVYYGKVRTLSYNGNGNAKVHAFIWNPFHAYKLADKFYLPELKDCIMDAYITSLEHRFFPTVLTISEAFKIIETHDSMRQFMVEAYRWILKQNSDDDLKNWPTAGSEYPSTEAHQSIFSCHDCHPKGCASSRPQKYARMPLLLPRGGKMPPEPEEWTVGHDI